MNIAPDDRAYIVPPVERAFKLLRHIASGGTCVNVSGTAKMLGINRTTLFRLLHTLEAEGMIEARDAGAGWQLGTGMIVLAADALHSRDFVQAGRRVMKRLAAEKMLSAHLGVLDGNEIIYLAREAPNSHLVSNISEGTRLPAHATTVGRILLSYLPAEELQALYGDGKLVAFSSLTATTLATLTNQIAADRANGYAWSKGNFEIGIGSCAVPIRDHTGRVMAALNVTGPESRFAVEGAEKDGIISALIGAAAEISAALGYRQP